MSGSIVNERSRLLKRDEFPLLPSYGATRPPELTYSMGSCGIAGCINASGGRISGDNIAKMLTTMSERENGLGAGYACYGLFPELADMYCLQFLFDNEKAMTTVEEILKNRGDIVKDEKIFHKERPDHEASVPNSMALFFQTEPEIRKVLDMPFGG